MVYYVSQLPLTKLELSEEPAHVVGVGGDGIGILKTSPKAFSLSDVKSPVLHQEALDDAAIVASLKNREPAAMANLYVKYGRIVYFLAVHVLGNAGEAEEVAQEVFLRVWTRAHLIDLSSDSLAPWLVVVARNLAVDYLRAARSRGRNEQVPFESVQPAETYLSARIDYRRAFQSLSCEQRQAIEFAYFEGLSQVEISKRMKRPLGTVKSWIRTALGDLRQALS